MPAKVIDPERSAKARAAGIMSALSDGKKIMLTQDDFTTPESRVVLPAILRRLAPLNQALGILGNRRVSLENARDLAAAATPDLVHMLIVVAQDEGASARDRIAAVRLVFDLAGAILPPTTGQHDKDVRDMAPADLRRMIEVARAREAALEGMLSEQHSDSLSDDRAT